MCSTHYATRKRVAMTCFRLRHQISWWLWCFNYGATTGSGASTTRQKGRSHSLKLYCSILLHVAYFRFLLRSLTCNLCYILNFTRIKFSASTEAVCWSFCSGVSITLCSSKVRILNINSHLLDVSSIAIKLSPVLHDPEKFLQVLHLNIYPTKSVLLLASSSFCFFSILCASLISIISNYLCESQS